MGFAATAGLCAASALGHAQPLETETARLLSKGTYEVGTAFEFQTSAEGTERAVPLALEYAVTDRLSTLVEPVAYTAIRPKRGARATGLGDLEATGFYLLRGETRRVPALAVALEVKLPTTKDNLIGTGRTDFSSYVIASKRVGRLDAHANLGYTIPGQPPGARLNNTFNGALAGECHLSQRVEVFGEVLGSSASVPEGGGDNPVNQNVVVPEAAGGELVGTLGVGVSPLPHLLFSVGLSYDNSNAFLLRPGLTYRLQ